MDDPLDLDQALITVAKHAAATAVRTLEWDDYPDVGEYDWNAVRGLLEDLHPFPPAELFEAAHDYLEARTRTAVPG